MRPQIDESSKTTAFSHQDRSGRGSRYKSRNFPFREVPRVASASSVLGVIDLLRNNAFYTGENSLAWRKLEYLWNAEAEEMQTNFCIFGRAQLKNGA